MRPFLLLALALPACSFEIAPVVYEPGVLPEGGGALADMPAPDDPAPLPGDGPPAFPDGGPPIDLTQPRDIEPQSTDLIVKPPAVLLALDARGPNAWQVLAQPAIRDYANVTIGHYKFDEIGTGGLVDSSGKGNDLAPGGGSFGGNRRLFTHIPAAGGGGLTRVATEFTGRGFVAASNNVLDIAAQDFTVELWLKLPPGYTPLSKNPACDPIVQKGPQPGYSVCVGAGGKLRMRAGGPMSIKEVETTVGFADGAWHYATFAFGVTAPDTGSIYVDGKNFTPVARDLSQPSVSNMKAPFSVADGGGAAQVFGGSLAELVVHAGKLVSPGEHHDQYVAFGVPIAAGSAAPGANLTYQRGSPLCTVVADDAVLGDRVACYAGGGGIPDQVALERSARADKTGNPDRIGLAIAPLAENLVDATEQLDQWSKSNVTVVTDAVASPRGDQTAETLTVKSGGYLILVDYQIKGNLTVTLSMWMRGRNDGDYTYLEITDGNRKEFGHCLVSLSKQWRRYSCTQTFTINPQFVLIGPDGLDLNVPVSPMQTVTFDAWGAQLEIAPEPSLYVPNVDQARVTRSPVTISLSNAGGMFLGGAAGRARVTFTTDGGGLDNSYLFDTMPQPIGRHYLRRAGGGDLVGEVSDKLGAVANDSTMTIKAVDWALPHDLSLAWSSQKALPGNVHTSVSLDAKAPQGGRAQAYEGATPATVFLLSDGSGKNQPAGSVQTLTLSDAP